MNGPTPEEQMRRMSRRGFLWGALATVGAYGGFHYIATRSEADGVPWPLRIGLQTNDALAEDYFSPRSLAKTYPVGAAVMPKRNGFYGLESDIDLAAWKLAVVGGAQENLEVGIQEIKALPAVDMVTELRCIEGWTVIVHWTGCKLADFIARYPPAKDTDPRYIGLMTPDGEYYVGLDIESAKHPQTLLCWAMNGEPLSLAHGAPLRLVIPTKYGVKNLKRIGTLTYSSDRPADYWAEEGYDWYAGL